MRKFESRLPSVREWVLRRRFFFCAERELGKQGGKWDNTNNAMRFEGDIKSQGFCKGHFIFDRQKYV